MNSYWAYITFFSCKLRVIIERCEVLTIVECSVECNLNLRTDRDKNLVSIFLFLVLIFLFLCDCVSNLDVSKVASCHG